MATILKQRRFPVTHSVTGGDVESLLTRLRATSGVQQVDRIEPTNELAIQYDLLRTDSESIRGIIRESGLIPASHFLDKIRWSVIAYTEKNERDAFSAPTMACCSNPDKMLETGRHQAKHAGCH